MSDVMTRRAYLLAAIQDQDEPVTTHRAVQLLTESPWPSAGRNTARKDLRALAARGHLTIHNAAGRREYAPSTETQ